MGWTAPPCGVREASYPVRWYPHLWEGNVLGKAASNHVSPVIPVIPASLLCHGALGALGEASTALAGRRSRRSRTWAPSRRSSQQPVSTPPPGTKDENPHDALLFRPLPVPSPGELCPGKAHRPSRSLAIRLPSKISTSGATNLFFSLGPGTREEELPLSGASAWPARFLARPPTRVPARAPCLGEQGSSMSPLLGLSQFSAGTIRNGKPRARVIEQGGEGPFAGKEYEPRRQD